MFEDSGNELLECLKAARNWEPGQERPKKPIHKALELFDKDFTDDKETVVIIDEIQESAAIYNLIREFTRSFDHCILLREKKELDTDSFSENLQKLVLTIQQSRDWYRRIMCF